MREDISLKAHRSIREASAKRTSRWGTQVVRINADLLHFHSAPSAVESSIEGVDWIGSKVAMHASATITMSKGRIAVIPLFDSGWLISGIGFSLTSRAEENGFVIN